MLPVPGAGPMLQTNLVVLSVLFTAVSCLRFRGELNFDSPRVGEAIRIGNDEAFFGFIDNGKGRLDIEAETDFDPRRSLIPSLSSGKEPTSEDELNAAELAAELCLGVAVCDVGAAVVRDFALRRKQPLFFNSQGLSIEALGKMTCEPAELPSPCTNILLQTGRVDARIHLAPSRDVPEDPPTSWPAGANVDANITLPLGFGSGAGRAIQQSIFLVSVAPCRCKARKNPQDPLEFFSIRDARNDAAQNGTQAGENTEVGADQGGEAAADENEASADANNEEDEDPVHVAELIPGPLTSIKFDVHMLNTEETFPELGWEESWYPVGSLVITAVLGATFLVSVLSLIATRVLKLPLPRILLVGLVAISGKLLSSGLVLGFFRHLARTGGTILGLAYLRLLFMFFSDASLVAFVVLLALGNEFFPESWYQEGQARTVQLGISLFIEIVIVIAVKMIFPYQGISAVLYGFGGLAICIISVGAALRLMFFLNHFNHAIHQSYIRQKSTPIPGLIRFFASTVVILPIAFAVSLWVLVVADYRTRRPDMLWIIWEGIDALVLLWFSLMIFPRKSFGLYVDMSAVGNERLNAADAWRRREQMRIEARRQQGDREANGPGTRTAAPVGELPQTIHDEENPAVGSESADAAVTNDSSPPEQEQSRDSRRNEPSLPNRPQADTADTSSQLDEAHDDPEPEWISWRPGIPLPVPTREMWGNQSGSHGTAGQRRHGGLGAGFTELDPIRPRLVFGIPDPNHYAKGLVDVKVGEPVLGPASVVDLAPRPERETGKKTEIALEDSRGAAGDETSEGQDGDVETTARNVALDRVAQGNTGHVTLDVDSEDDNRSTISCATGDGAFIRVLEPEEPNNSPDRNG